MKKENDVDLNLLKDEEILFESRSIENSSFSLIFFPSMWMIVAFFFNFWTIKLIFN